MAHILIIDDDEQVRTTLQQLLGREGYEAVTAPDGKAGIRLFREQEADLIILDIIMPEKDGIETILELRRDYPYVKIIVTIQRKKSKSSKKRLDKVLGENQENRFESKAFHISPTGASDSKT